MSAGDDLVSIDSFVQHNATACAYLASLSDTLNTPTPSGRPSLSQQGSCNTLLTLDQLLNGSETKAAVPAVYKTCLSECLLGTTDFDALLIGLSDLYDQVRWQLCKLHVEHIKSCWPAKQYLYLASMITRTHTRLHPAHLQNRRLLAARSACAG